MRPFAGAARGEYWTGSHSPPPERVAWAWGGRLMHQALASCAARWPEKPVTLSAQAHLQAFYRALGFAAVTDIYDEDGIPHIGMRRPSPCTLKE